ncbi:DUF6683 family protein [uncultured Sphingomonas sp.]|uniref:DUF6683 family protein n=1 Tax=uncultured Sphingomonas sp. TaxID=158754 RepID=UPI0025FFAEDA|nr:DUF6683 family protein [uncultured Sphingomonas sp.]
MKKILGALALVVASAWSSNATAQMWDSTQLSLMLPSMYHTDPLSITLEDRERRGETRARRVAPNAPNLRAPRTLQPAELATLRYTPSKARRTANLATFVQKTRAGDPRGAADLQKLFAEGDFIEKIGALVAPQGLHIDNVADAYALWWITAWQAAHGNNDTPSRAVLSAVRQQAASAVAATGEIAHASDAQKQELAEALWVQSALIDGAVEQAKRDPSRLRAVGDAVRKGAKGLGLNLDAIDLTSQGFVPVGVGQNDAPSTTPKPGSTAPYGALALAAGGMGVGGFLMLRQRRG